MATATSSPDAKCRLLELPPEVRNRIYHFALLGKEHSHLTKEYNQPGLLTSCRQIRSEAYNVYYANNAFTVNFDLCVRWLESLPTATRSQLKEVKAAVEECKQQRILEDVMEWLSYFDEVNRIGSKLREMGMEGKVWVEGYDVLGHRCGVVLVRG